MVESQRRHCERTRIIILTDGMGSEFSDFFMMCKIDGISFLVSYSCEAGSGSGYC